jgi:hypothetical protein
MRRATGTLLLAEEVGRAVMLLSLLVVLVLVVVVEEGLYRRMERSEEPARMYVPGDAEYARAWTGPMEC